MIDLRLLRLLLMIVAMVLAYIVPGFAQNQSSDDLRRLITVVEQQRNLALTLQAQAEAKVMALTDENRELKMQIDTLSKVPRLPQENEKN